MKMMLMFVFMAFLGIGVAQAQMSYRDTAEVIAVEPMIRQVRVDGQCTAPAAQSERSTLGTILGGVVGAIVGNQIGAGSGNVIATAVGASIGSAIGGDIGGDRNRSAPTASVGCTTGYMEERVVMYRARVLYNGREFPVSSVRPLQVGELINLRVTLHAD